MVRRFIAFAGCTSALAALDLAAKARWATPPELLHERSTAWILASSVLLSCCFTLALVSPPFVRAAAATCAAGLAGNLMSALTHDGRIPDPFVLGGAHGIAFNPADAFFVLGLSGLVGAALQSRVNATRNRRKPEPEWFG
jgi:hypothetical protein